MKLHIPALPPSLNKTSRMHWRAQRRLNDNRRLWIRAYLPEYYLKPIVRMRCKITLHHSRPYDTDNAYGAVKPVVDALRAWQLIFDDTKEYLDLTVEQAKSNRKKPLTVIELSPE